MTMPETVAEWHSLTIEDTVEWRDPENTIFNRSTVANGRFNLLILAARAMTLLAATNGECA